MTEPKFRIEKGEQIYHHGNHHPCRETGTIWYRHDKVFVGDRQLEGFIQVKERRLIILGRDMKRNRIETLTCSPVGGCVPGSEPEWLLRQQPSQETVSA